MSYELIIEQAKDKVTEKDFDQALNLFNQALEINTKGKEALYERGVLYTNLSQLELALFDFNKLIEIENDNSFYYACRAYVKTELKDISGAIADYEITLKFNPDDALTLNNLGLLQEQLGFKSQAEKSFTKSNNVLGYNPERKRSKSNKNNSNKSDSPTSKAVFKSVLTSKKGFKEFINFIKNGFKIKDND